MVASAKAGPSLHLHEYSITDGTDKVKQRIHSTDQVTINIDVFSEDGKSMYSKDGTAVKKTKGIKQQITSGSEGECQNVIFVEPIIDGSTPTALAFKKLEQSVENLEQRFEALEELSTNPELVERLKGNITDPLVDMWNIINMNKRLDAAEQGIDKLASIVQDVIKSGTDLEIVGDQLKASRDDKEKTDDDNNNVNIDNTINETNQHTLGDEETTVIDAPNAENVVSVIYSAEFESKKAPTIADKPNDSKRLDELRDQKIEKCFQNIEAVKTTIDVALTKLEDRLHKLETKERTIDTTAKIDDESAPTLAPADDHSPDELDKKKIHVCLEYLQDFQTTIDNTFINMEGRLKKLEKDHDELTEKLKSVAIPSETGDSDLNELVSKIQDIQEDMRKLNETADRLMGDTEDREMNLNAMLEQIELLKTIKADKEDLEDALADKADAYTVNRKVSHDQFDAACDDLTRGLEEAISKLGKQESIWHQALDEVQKEIEGKVDKIEITPLREFVNSRLKSLQEKMKRMAEMRREAEAAGTKKLLRDVQCISCDKEVVMRTEETGKFEAPTMPCTMSMKPYLTYELDQVRKQQRRLPHSRNMIQFEAAVLEETRKMKISKEESFAKSPRDHLCNRYCGGSHTITTPQQRVMRMGHFLTQWGPESIQLTDGMIKGTDGKMYRSRPLPPKYDVCGGIVPCPANEVITSQETSRGTGNMSQPWQTARSTSSAKKGNSGRISTRKKDVCPGISTEHEQNVSESNQINKVALEVQSTTEA
ncbi:glutamine-rich protein 2-like [Vespa mandarinia]|uniref:glutamine-rich protein 2-like n=1 Tax=Vespa mandarinia TaxID=7446 RepID=UPI00161A67EC|nr:glutamine-rich protein 2-like [Vespa mandarinia]